jgi:replicative DNA helicase
MSGGPSTNGAWEAPIPIGRGGEGRRFPTDALPPWLREFVEHLSTATQTPPDMAGCFGLAALATAAGGRLYVRPSPDWEEPVNLFVLVVADPGERKSAVHREVVAPILEYEAELQARVKPDVARETNRIRIVEAELAAAQKGVVGKKGDDRLAAMADAEELALNLDGLRIPTEPQLFADDVTPEQLATLIHAQGGRMAVLSAEAGIFDVLAGRYTSGSAHLDVLLKGHAGDTLRVNRRGRAEFIARPALTVGLAVQPSVLRDLQANATMVGRGLLARFLYAIPMSIVGNRQVSPPPVPAQVRERYGTTLRALAASLNQLDMPHTLSLEPDAERALTDWRGQLEPRRRADGDLAHLRAWSSKLDGATVRLAGLLHVADRLAGEWGAPIALRTMLQAVELAGYFLDQALLAFDVMGVDDNARIARDVVDWIRRGRYNEFTRRDCHRAHQRVRAAELAPALELLVDHAWIRALEKNDQRRSVLYEVNPAALG